MSARPRRYFSYAVVYSSDGDFLLATKLQYGFFFATTISPPTGVIKRGGQQLNGGGELALPGGEANVGNGEDQVSAAVREFYEETGEDLSGIAHSATVLPWTFGGTNRSRTTDFYYGAAYFNVSASDLADM